MRSEGEAANMVPGTTASFACQVHSGLCSTASMMMLSSNCVGSAMLPSSSYTNCSIPVLIPLLTVGKIRIPLLEVQQPKRVGTDCSFPQLSGAWVSMDQDSSFLHDSSNPFWINSFFLECFG